MKFLKYVFIMLLGIAAFACSEEPVLKDGGDGDDDDDPIHIPPPPPPPNGRVAVPIDTVNAQ